MGDPEQLQAIEAGAAFRALAERHGVAEIAEVRRQREGWQREATRELATARTEIALSRYEAAGMVRGHATQEEARAALVAGWAAERGESPTASRVMLAHTQADVAALNGLARARLRQAGELGVEHQVATERGPRAMAAGERVMFLRNERGLGAEPSGQRGVAVKNGTLGTVLAVRGAGEDARLVVRLDGVGSGKTADVTFSLRDYAHLDHGYAATVHKAQGVTVDRAHVLAGAGMDRHMAYVALTRHREGVALHWSAEAMGSREGLGRALGRQRAKDTTLDYGESFAERRGLHPLAPASEIVVRRIEPKTASSSREAAREAAPSPLLPAHRDPQGRDSLGRGTTPTDLAAAAEVHPWVRQHTADRERHLYEAYREPDEAGRRLHDLIQREGGDLTRTAAVLGQEGPEALGALHGREGWFAGQAAKNERVRAVSAVQAIGWGLKREASDRERVTREHVGVVGGQRKRNAVEVPGLSRAAWSAVQAVEAAREGGVGPGPPGEESWQRFARERGAVADAWEREVVAKSAVAAELRAFAEAAEKRLGYDAEKVLRWAEADRGAPEEKRPREGLAAVARALAAERAGRGTHEDQQQAAERQREAEQKRLGLRQGRGMRM